MADGPVSHDTPLPGPAAFGQAGRLGTGQQAEQPIAQQRHAGPVTSLLFDDLKAAAGGALGLRASRIERIALPLSRPSRRRVRWMLRGSLTVQGLGEITASLQRGGRCKRFTLRGTAQQPGPNGELPVRHLPLDMTITEARSSVKRDRVEALLWLEASVAGGQADAAVTVDSLDIAAV